MQSKDVLKNALLQYEGSMILVSHDRDFLQGLSTKVVEFRDHGIKTYLGDVYDFLEKKKIDSLKALENAGNVQEGGDKAKTSSNKVQYEQKKAQDAAERKRNNQVKKLEAELEALNQKKTEIEAQLAQPELYAEQIASGELYQQYQEIQKQIEDTEWKWLEVADN